MAKFPSTLLPNSNDVTEIRKAILDLLAKINEVEVKDWALHYHSSQYTADIYTNAAPVAGTFYTVTVTGLPAGTEEIEIAGHLFGTVGGDWLVWRPYGSSDTFVQSGHRIIGMVPVNNSYGLVTGLVTVDSFGRFQVAVNNAGTDIYIRGYSFCDMAQG